MGGSMAGMLGVVIYGLGRGVGFIVIGVLVFWFIQDVTQKKHAVLRNYPVIGRLRYFFEKQGEYFRQYLFMNDREELPFNRSARSWVYRLAKAEGGIIGCGSTNNTNEPGSILFVNAPYPVLEEDRLPTPSLVIGEGYARAPFEAKSIVNISGMCVGAIAAPDVRSLSHGAALAGCWMDTGEGGLSPYHVEGGCDIIMQIGTAKYGIRDRDGKLSAERAKELAQQVKAFEIKLSQGAKPGKGGVLPAGKVTAEIARIRGIPAHQDSISPNRHLAIDGGEGGSGAAPQALMDHMALPIAEALPRVVDALIESGLRQRIRVITAGKLITSARAAWALCVGADFVNTARGFMFSLGCIQALRCHQNSCPTGVTTHDKRLQRGLVVQEKRLRVAQYAIGMNREIDMIAHSCGCRQARELRREHVRVVQSAGQSVALNILYPYPEAASKLRAA